MHAYHTILLSGVECVFTRPNKHDGCVTGVNHLDYILLSFVPVVFFRQKSISPLTSVS